MGIDWEKLTEFMARAEKVTASTWDAMVKEAQEFETKTRGLAMEHLYLFEP